MPQSAEHLAALDALGVGYGLLVVTRADLADPAAALASSTATLSLVPSDTTPEVGDTVIVAALDGTSSQAPLFTTARYCVVCVRAGGV